MALEHSDAILAKFWHDRQRVADARGGLRPALGRLHRFGAHLTQFVNQPAVCRDRGRFAFADPRGAVSIPVNKSQFITIKIHIAKYFAIYYDLPIENH